MLTTKNPARMSGFLLRPEGPRSPRDLWDTLVAHRLMTEAQAAALSRVHAQTTTASLLESLVRDNALTTYQAKQITLGAAHRLALGQYLILDELGRGGFGQVFKALHTVMRRVVALKVISPHLIENERVRSWFRREVLAATPLAHPNVVMAHDANEVDGVLFLVMEFVEGLDLDNVVRARGPLPFDLAAEIFRQAALGLQHAHEKGMVHRDIKPANLLIVPRGLEQFAAGAAKDPIVKIVDFGLARLQAGGNAQTIVLQNEKGFAGTPDFISPEQAADIHSADIRSDLYSLGCSLYFALSGAKPFASETALEVIVKQMQKEAAPLETIVPGIPPAFEAITARLMAKDPHKRFQTPRELVEEIERHQEEIARVTRACPSAKDFVLPTAEVSGTAVLAGLAFNSGLAPEDPGTAVYQPEVEPEKQSEPPPKVVTPHPGVGATRETRSSAVEPAPLIQQRLDKEALPLSDVDWAAALEKVKERWRAWRDVVRRLAAGKAPKDVSESSYATLYASLLAACRVSGAAPEGARLLRRIESSVEPWVKLRTLAGADAEAMETLLAACLGIDRALGERRSGGAGWFLFALALVFAAGFAFFWFRR